MTDRDKSILECSEKMCEYCCNFDKEHIGMDGMALCKLTMTLAYCEDYGGNCMFYNVPKEQIIVPPCKVGDTTYIFDYEVNNHLESKLRGIAPSIVEAIVIEDEGVWVENEHAKYHITAFGDIIFLTKEEAEKALKERSEGE